MSPQIKPPPLAREICFDLDLTLIQRRRYEDSISQKELTINLEHKVRVLGVFEEQWLPDGLSSFVGLIVKRVEVGNKRVTDLEGLAGRGKDTVWPNIGLLGGCADRVVVPGERVEGSELVPTQAEFFGRVTDESTDICASEGDAKKTKG